MRPGASGSPDSSQPSRLRIAALYAGGFLGPFGGGVTASMLPELGADLGLSPAGAAASLTAYLVPFALLMLVSGTLGQRWGPARTVRTAYVAYVLFSLVAAAVSTGWVFLAARALQGATNAFTTPLILASLAAATPTERLGRTLGLFGSIQATAQTLAPLVGGLAAEVSWRWAFVGAAAVAAVLAAAGLPTSRGAARDAPEGRARLRAAWTPRVLRLGVLAALCWGSLGGLAFMVALRFGDAFALSAGVRGALLTVFGVVGLLTSLAVGAAVDRWGAPATIRLGTLLGAVMMGLIGVLPSVVAIAAVWALAGMASQCGLVGVNVLALREPNGSGAVSIVQSLRFVGAAAAPAVFLAPYHFSAVAGFGLASVVLVGAAVLVPRNRALTA